MNKSYINSLLLIVFSLAIAAPAAISAQFTVDSLKQKALETIKKAKAAMPDAGYWKDKTVSKAKRMWYCLNNKSHCSQGEVNEARAWIIGVPVALASALLIVSGALAAKGQQCAQIECKFVKDLAVFFNRDGYANINQMKLTDKQAAGNAMAMQGYGFDNYSQFYGYYGQVKDEYLKRAFIVKISGQDKYPINYNRDSDFDFTPFGQQGL